MAKKVKQDIEQVGSRKRPVKNSEKEERYVYTEDTNDRRADLGHGFSVKTGLKYADISDDENGGKKCGKDT